MNDFMSALNELEDASITREFLARLSGCGRAQGALFADRFSRLPEVRRLEIVASMVYHAEEDFALNFDELYRVCLDDESPLVRRQAVEGLWEDERPDLALRLARILTEDPSPEVRAAAASSLGRFVFLGECEELSEAKARRVREALELCIASEHEPVEVRRRAVEAIAYINDLDVRRIIDRAYADAHPLMRLSAVFAMGRSADPFWAETVLAELHSDAPAMRFEAARACGEMVLKAAAPTLIRMATEERDSQVQLMAVWALGQIGGARVRRALERLLESDDDALVEAAEEALEQLDFGRRSFDLMVVDLEEQGLAEEPDTFDEEAAEYRREFERYLEEDQEGGADSGADDALDEEDWPDEFLEIG